MSQFRSSSFPQRQPEQSTPFAGMIPATPPITRSLVDTPAQPQRQTDPLPLKIKRTDQQTDQLVPLNTQPNGSQISQSLITPLQLQISLVPASDVQKKTTIIPGTKRGAPVTRKLPEPGTQKHISPRLRYSIIMIATLGITLMTLLTLSPLSDTGTHIPVLGGVIQWVHSQQQDMGVAVHSLNSDTQAQQQGSTPADMVHTTSTQSGDYESIARADARAHGIPEQYFVNQINAESGFDPNAMSPVGAIGIAQFMPATAAGFGIDPWDPIQSLNAAAEYMSELNAQNNGNYAMALAAYNCGQGNVDIAIQEGGANWEEYVPAESQNYIVKIMG